MGKGQGVDVAENEAQGEGMLPESWVWTTIGEVAETTSGDTPFRKRPEYYTDGIIPWVKSGELRDGIISEVEESITEEALDKSSAKVFPRGTPVVALYGATVGRTGILAVDAATNQAVCAMFALDNTFTSKFITYWLQQQRAILIGLSSSGAQPNISQRIVRAFPFPLASLAEQRRIVAEVDRRLSVVAALEAEVEAALARAARLRQSILKRAFEGRLLSPVTVGAIRELPDYEPASALLARIKAGREAGKGGPKKKKKQPQQLELFE
jgi:type I restriction enzyme S subunit